MTFKIQRTQKIEEIHVNNKRCDNLFNNSQLGFTETMKKYSLIAIKRMSKRINCVISELIRA